MATGTGGGENPASETFRKYSADLLTAIQDPEVLAWELYAKNIITTAVRDAASYMMHERGVRTSKLLSAVESRITTDPKVFDVFLSVLSKRPYMSDLCGRMKEHSSANGTGVKFQCYRICPPPSLTSNSSRGAPVLRIFPVLGEKLVSQSER